MAMPPAAPAFVSPQQDFKVTSTDGDGEPNSSANTGAIALLLVVGFLGAGMGLVALLPTLGSNRRAYGRPQRWVDKLADFVVPKTSQYGPNPFYDYY